MKNDKDLKKIKDLLQAEKPTDLDVQKWKSALRVRQKAKRSVPLWVHWTAAACIGFIIGTSFSFMKKQDAKEVLTADATIEHVYTKL